MTTTNAYSRQPTKFDYASPTQFKFQITKLPKVEYFTTACNIPGISLNATVQPTPLADIPLPGDTIIFNDLEITFLVDENLENYREIHGWMYGIGFQKQEHNSQTWWRLIKIDFRQRVELVRLQTQVKLSMVLKG